MSRRERKRCTSGGTAAVDHASASSTKRGVTAPPSASAPAAVRRRKAARVEDAPLVPATPGSMPGVAKAKQRRTAACAGYAVLRRVGEVFVLRELAQCFRLDLADALAGQAELLADRLERSRAFTDEAEAKLDHVPLAGRQVRDRLAYGEVAERGGRLLLGRRARAGDQVAKRCVAVVADRHVGGRDGTCGGEHLVHVVERQLRVLRDLLGRRIALERCDELAARAGDLLLALDHVHRNANGARLVGDAALDRLADPPRRVRGELEALAPVELLGGADQAEHTLLDEIAEGDALRLVALCDRDDEAQVAVDHAILRRHVTALDPLRQLDLLRRGEQRVAAGLVEEHLE